MLILKLRNLWMATNSFKLLSIISRAVNLKYTFILWPIINYVFMYYEGRGREGGGGINLGKSYRGRYQRLKILFTMLIWFMLGGNK